MKEFALLKRGTVVDIAPEGSSAPDLICVDFVGDDSGNADVIVIEGHRVSAEEAQGVQDA